MSKSSAGSALDIVQTNPAEEKQPYQKRYAIYQCIAVSVGGLAASYSLITWPAEIGVWLKGATSGIEALATFFIACFTLALIVVGKNTIREMRDSAHREQRAYIQVSFPFNDPNPYNEGPYFHDVVVDVVNHGQTPASNVRFSGWYEISASDSTHDYDRGVKSCEMPNGPQPCAPGTSSESRLRFAIRPPGDHAGITAARLREGAKGHLYIFGTITYNDIFGHEWTTHFCARLVPKLLDRVDRYGWVSCSHAAHNAAT